MQNPLMDYYPTPKRSTGLHSALCDLYIAYLDRGVREPAPRRLLDKRRPGHQKQP